MEIDVSIEPKTSGISEPISFVLGEKTLTVKDVMDRWLASEHEYFKVLASDGAVYKLRREVDKTNWELVSFDFPGADSYPDP